MPSPEQLKRKIIIKHKKLPEGVDEATPPICNANDSIAQSSNEECECIFIFIFYLNLCIIIIIIIYCIPCSWFWIIFNYF